MATSSRQTALFGINDWKRFYSTYNDADLSSYDYESIRKAFIDYLIAYYPETFSDFIESSEFIALLDVMAFMGQALAFRGDLNARENFIDTAERRDSVVKLANLVGYTTKRNIAAAGLLKVSAISTTEQLSDVNGNNLNNTTVFFNDPANALWSDQFNTIINAALVNSQRVGRPGNSATLLGIKTDEYSISIPAGELPVSPFNATINDVDVNFELVSVSSVNKTSLVELPPLPNGQFNMVYRSDNAGYGSPNTGFFVYFKQGNLTNYDFSITDRIENNLVPIDVEGVNNTDTWLYEVDNIGAIIEVWTQVDNVYYNNTVQNPTAKKIFSVNSGFNDSVSYVFGDGVFGDIPVGFYRAYVRPSNAQTYTITPSEMQGIAVKIDYVSRLNRLETLTLTLSLQTTISTAQARESLSQIKLRAPARYYTQNRMVNGEDYSNFPFTLYSSIIKSAALNRSSIGVSRNLELLDPTGKYSITNVFGSDGAIFVETGNNYTTFSTLSTGLASEFLSLTLPSYLNDVSTIDYYLANCARFTGAYSGTDSVDGKVYWQRATVDSNSSTGYFYVLSSGGMKIPVAVGDYTTFNLRHVGRGANLKFVPPSTATQYFDADNQIVTGVASPSDKTEIYVNVAEIVGDGYNFGVGLLSNGRGPITLAGYVPSGAALDPTITAGEFGVAIIPAYDTALGLSLTQDILRNQITPHYNFNLYYNNSLSNQVERWSCTSSAPPTPDDLLMAQFTFNVADNTYTVAVKTQNYQFGSAGEVRFHFDSSSKIFDDLTGQTISDYITIISTKNTTTNVVGQPTLSDGYSDDYTVSISSINSDSSTTNPDFFNSLVSPNSTVFFKVITDTNNLTRNQLLAPGAVKTAYSTINQIKLNMYEYSSGTVFYAKSGLGTTDTSPRFYMSTTVVGTSPVVIDLVDVTASYVAKTGTGGLKFQYRRNSDNSVRIDPATTNIIDLYLVTQGYYTSYRNWLNDTTNSVAKPKMPTMQELEASYSQLNDYKMLSDSVVLNSVDFKPLFGSRAESALQGKIKVIKAYNTTASDSIIRANVVSAMNDYFTIDKWDFGDTFYASELISYLHVQLAGLVSSVVIVPNDPTKSFGDLYEIRSKPYEIFVNGANTNDVVVVSALTNSVLNRS
jgi:hypothetical protein